MLAISSKTQAGRNATTDEPRVMTIQHDYQDKPERSVATSILVSCTRRIGGGNLQSCLVESLRNPLREQLGFFNSNFRVGVMCKKTLKSSWR
jgi:hypothetical protein